MKKALFAIALLLTGCVSPEQVAQQNAAACTASGYKTGTEEFDWCMIKREQAQQQEQQEDAAYRSAVAGAALQSYASGMSRTTTPAPSASYSRPVSCTSNRVGTYTYTNCY